MTAPCVQVADWLIGAGLGKHDKSGTWLIAQAHEPANPNNTITVYDTGGRDPGCVGTDNPQPNVQVRVRSKDYTKAYDRMTKVSDEIKTHMLRQVGGINSLGQDDNARWRLTANFQFIGG